MEQNSCFTFDHQSGERTQQCATHSCKSMCVCKCMCAVVRTGSKTAADDPRHCQARRRKSRQTTQHTLRSLVRTRSRSLRCSCTHSPLRTLYLYGAPLIGCCCSKLFDTLSCCCFCLSGVFSFQESAKNTRANWIDAW